MKMKKWFQDKIHPKTTAPLAEQAPAAGWTQPQKPAFDAAFNDFRKIIALQGTNAPNYQEELAKFKETHAEYLESKGGLTQLIAREDRALKGMPEATKQANTEAMKAVQEDYDRLEAPRPE